MSCKKYKKGMADASAAYEAHGKKQEEALRYVLSQMGIVKDRVDDLFNKTDSMVSSIISELKAEEKAKLYTVYTPYDIIELGQQEREFLVGVLFCLTMDRLPNEEQKAYIRSVKKYLDIKEPPFGVDLMAVENIEDLSAQKAIFQVVIEFLVLQEGDSFDETDLQSEFLEAFSINRKTRETIMERTKVFYWAVGSEGLAEKYGYVPEIEVEESKKETEGNTRSPGKIILDESKLEEMVITNTLQIIEGESYSYQNKVIYVHAPINCKGKISFQNCIIHYGDTATINKITLGSTAALSMENCVIVCRATSTSNSYDVQSFINSPEKNVEIQFRQCEFRNCSYFLHVEGMFTMDSCRVVDPSDRFVWAAYSQNGQGTLSNCEIILQVNPKLGTEKRSKAIIELQYVCITDSQIKGLLDVFSAEEYEQITRNNDSTTLPLPTFFGKSLVCLLDVGSYLIERSTVVGLRKILSGKGTVAYTSFSDCVKIFSGTYSNPAVVQIDNCNFKKCMVIAEELSSGSVIQDSHFDSCFCELLSTDDSGGVEIKSCDFSNCETKRGKTEPMMFFRKTADSGRESRVQKCTFSGIKAHQGYLMAGNSTHGISVIVEDCTFESCTTGREDSVFIKEYCTRQ